MKKTLPKKFAAFIMCTIMFSGTVFSQWNTNGTHIYNSNTGKVGIGIGATTPAGKLTVKGSGGVPAATWANSGAPIFVGYGEQTVGNADYILGMASTVFNGRPVFIGRRSKGTLAAPLIVANNDYLMSFLASGYDGSAFQNPAAIDFYVDGAATAGNVPARISFVTGSNATTRAERFKIGSNGDITTTTGNFIMGSGAKTIQFATPLTTGGTAMMSMFPSGTSNADRMVIQHSNTYSNWGLEYSDALDKFNFLSSGTPVLTADLGGQRVGIMTSSPGARLDIAGSGTYDLSGAGNYADFRLGDAAYNIKMGVANSGGGAGDAYVAGSGRLYLGTGNTLANSQTVAINSDGTVGIGSYVAGGKLGVTGDATSTSPTLNVATSYVGNVDVRGINSLSKAADGYGYGVYGTGGYMGGYLSADAGAYTGNGYGVYGYASGTAGSRYGVYGSASGGTENWGGYFPTKTYTNELRVGGTQGATGYVASINGKLIATEVRVQPAANWPDYVFGKDHILMSLEELEASINANKHLPGIPSAADVKDNGIMLGEMQTKAMEKIEENTLYILQINNKVKEVEKINNDKTKELDILNDKIKVLEQKIELLTRLVK